MEPFRVLIDKQIVKSLNLKQFNKKDLKFEKGAFVLPFDLYPKYANVFLECLMDNKEDIFSYVQEYYRHVMDSQKYDFPFYDVKK
jgi:CRISPR-associated protein Cas1